jgi:hypothetical protein
MHSPACTQGVMTACHTTKAQVSSPAPLGGHRGAPKIARPALRDHDREVIEERRHRAPGQARPSAQPPGIGTAPAHPSARRHQHVSEHRPPATTVSSATASRFGAVGPLAVTAGWGRSWWCSPQQTRSLCGAREPGLWSNWLITASVQLVSAALVLSELPGVLEDKLPHALSSPASSTAARGRLLYPVA